MTIIGAVRDPVLRVNTRGNLEKFLTLWVRCEGQMDKLLIMINAMSHPSHVRSQLLLTKVMTRVFTEKSLPHRYCRQVMSLC